MNLKELLQHPRSHGLRQADFALAPPAKNQPLIPRRYFPVTKSAPR